jgi:hypothetical protein
VADRVVLHIGTMKSGTTYLQAVLTSGALDEVGGFYPGGRFGTQTRAVRRLLRPVEQRQPRPWQELAEEVRERDGVAVFSQEFLSFARRERAAQLVGSFDGTPVEVVLAVRDQRSAIAAQWQSYVRNRGTDDLATYVDRLQARGKRGRRTKAARSFRRAQDVPGILRRWNGHDGASVSVVVVPPAGSAPAALWHRFCEAAGLEAHDPPAAAVPANESLGYASCDALRRINAQMERLPMDRYRRARKGVIEALLPLRPEEERPRLDASGLAFAAGLNRAIAAAVQAPGVRLVGSVDELPADVPVAAPATIEPPDEAHVRRALEAAWHATFPRRPLPEGDLDAVADPPVRSGRWPPRSVAAGRVACRPWVRGRSSRCTWGLPRAGPPRSRTSWRATARCCATTATSTRASGRGTSSRRWTCATPASAGTGSRTPREPGTGSSSRCSPTTGRRCCPTR